MGIPVLITYSNYGYKDFANNLLINLSKKLKNHSVHFYCLDENIYNYLNNKNYDDLKVTFEKFFKPVSSSFETYNSKNYITLTQTKIDVIRDSLKKYEFVHFIDCDVVCINEPPEDFYKEYEEYDIVFQFDSGPAPTLFGGWTCTGNTSFKKSHGTNTMLNRIEQYQKSPAHRNKNDQECLFQFFNDLNWADDIRKDTDCKNYVYPIEKYTNGYMINNNIIDVKNTYFFHANHVSGSSEKINLLKKVKEWYI
jgi:hypothetical protein